MKSKGCKTICTCRKFFWKDIECEVCKTARIESNKQYRLDHTFTYGEEVIIDDEFIGKDIKVVVVDTRTEHYHCFECPSIGGSSTYYSVKLPDGNIKEYYNTSLKKIK